MLKIAAVAELLERFAPRSLAEEWDNVGLLVGDRQATVERIMTCLTITPASAQEAIRGRANLIVAHHPLPFHPLKRLTTDNTTGRLLLDLIAAGVAVYSPHTSFDSAEFGINQQLAAGLGLQAIAPMVEQAGASESITLGAGRYGELDPALPLAELVERAKKFLKLAQLQVVGSASAAVSRVGVACGSGGEFLKHARRLECDCLVTGETNFHTCLEAEATGIALILPGHFASERLGVERLADYLATQFPTLRVWASAEEQDPLRWE